MPSKRTNDSVDRILEDLNIQQAQAGLRDSVTDRQVDTTSPLHARASVCAARAEHPAAAADDADPGGCGKYDRQSGL